MHVDLDRRLLCLGGRRVKLPRSQFNICAYLSRRPGWFRTRGQIMDFLYKPAAEPDSDRAIDSHVSKANRAMRAASGEVWILPDIGTEYYWREN